jgi:hypothetical protein
MKLYSDPPAIYANVKKSHLIYEDTVNASLYCYVNTKDFKAWLVLNAINFKTVSIFSYSRFS